VLDQVAQKKEEVLSQLRVTMLIPLHMDREEDQTNLLLWAPRVLQICGAKSWKRDDQENHLKNLVNAFRNNLPDVRIVAESSDGDSTMMGIKQAAAASLHWSADYPSQLISTFDYLHLYKLFRNPLFFEGKRTIVFGHHFVSRLTLFRAAKRVLSSNDLPTAFRPRMGDLLDDDRMDGSTTLRWSNPIFLRALAQADPNGRAIEVICNLLRTNLLVN